MQKVRSVYVNFSAGNEHVVKDSDNHSSYHVQRETRPVSVHQVMCEAQLGRLKCEYRLVELGGIPCSHVIAVHRFTHETLGGRCMHDRWILHP
jgi:hypothetical protein